MAVPAYLRLLLLQLLPILVFLVVDAFVQDPLWAIGAALLFVVFQTALTFARQRRLDPFILVDALLIGGLGAVSLLSKDELFFKLKPAIMEGVMVPFFLVLALGGDRLLSGYLGRYAMGMTVNPQAMPMLRRLLLGMTALVLLHAGAVVYAALRLSRQSWAWISGPGFYLLLLPVVGWALWRRLAMRRAARASADEGPARPRPAPSGRRRSRR
jgi:intracellular septation protein A